MWQQALAEVPKWILRQDADFRALMDFKPPQSPDALRVSLDNVDHAGVTKEMVYHTENTFRLPTLIHIAISAHYSSKRPKFGGLTVRQFMRNRPFEKQLSYAKSIMRWKGALK